jgi:Squalene-hopene cyclase C-terminal domain
MFDTPAVWLTASLLLTGAEPEKVPAGVVRKAIDKALPLLVKGAEGHVEKKACFACHNQAVPMLAFAMARERGFALPDELFKKQTTHVAAFLDNNREQFLKGHGTGGQVDSAGYALFTLERGGYKADDTTAAVVEYLLQYNQARDHWGVSGSRPPSEASLFTTNYLALRALQFWGPPEQKERIAGRIEAVRGWLLKTPSKDTEDRVFRLWALPLLKVDAKERKAAAGELLKAQRKDGGWSQLPNLESDAYATGSVLVVLHEVGELATTNAAYQRGVAYLIHSQREDGSWLIHSRSNPFQPYYESGFPHGKDQFISIAASGWATAALTLTLPVQRPERIPVPTQNLDP